MRSRRIVAVLLTAVALLASACGSDDDGGAAPPEPAPTEAPTTTDAEATPTEAPATTAAEPEPDEAPATTAAEPEPAEALSVALVANQKAGDLGPIDDLVRGLEMVEADFGADITFIEATDPSTFETTFATWPTRAPTSSR